MEGPRRKRDLNTMSARKSSSGCPVLNQFGQLHPWGVVQERDWNVREEGNRKAKSEEEQWRLRVKVFVMRDRRRWKRWIDLMRGRNAAGWIKERQKERIRDVPLENVFRRRLQGGAHIVDGLVLKDTSSSILICCEVQYIKASLNYGVSVVRNGHVFYHRI